MHSESSSKGAVKARDRRGISASVLPAVHLNVRHAGAGQVKASRASSGKFSEDRARLAMASRKALGTHAKTVSGHSGSDGNTVNSFRMRTRPQSKQEREQRAQEDQVRARLRRYKLQETAARILPGERVAACMRCRTAIAHTVDVCCTPGGGAHYRGLQTCGSVWHCAVCAGKVSEARRDELARLIKKHLAAGGSVYMTTYTVAHEQHDDLRDLLARFLAARRKMRQGRRGQALRKDFGIVGTCSVLEVTWSQENGWHPHVHELVFCGQRQMDVEGYERTARLAWRDAAQREGLSMNVHGFKLDRTYGAVADYVTKYGHQPASEKCWGVEAEMTKGHTKQGRIDGHYTPFALLAAIYDLRAEVVAAREQLAAAAPDGQAELVARLAQLKTWRNTFRERFEEYAGAFKGRKQLTFSPGLKERYQEEEKSDEELAGQLPGDAASFSLVELYQDQWQMVVQRGMRGELLEEARAGRPGRILDYLAGLGAEVWPEQYTRFERWRVVVPGGGLAVVTSVQRCDILGRWRCTVLLDEPGPDGRRWQAYDFDEIMLGLGSEPPGQEG